MKNLSLFPINLIPHRLGGFKCLPPDGHYHTCPYEEIRSAPEYHKEHNRYNYGVKSRNEVGLSGGHTEPNAVLLRHKGKSPITAVKIRENVDPDFFINEFLPKLRHSYQMSAVIRMP